MNLQQLAQVLANVIGVRGANGSQAQTAAVGWRDGWNTLFFAYQNSPTNGDLRVELASAVDRITGNIPHIHDARAAAANYSDILGQSLMHSGLQTASAHAEMLVLTAMIRDRAENPALSRSLAQEGRIPNAGPVLSKFTPQYINNRQQTMRDINTLATAFGKGHRQARIVANAPCCYFCANLLTKLNVEWGGLTMDQQQVYLDLTRGKRPLTGWWNPINDTGYAHGTTRWNDEIPGL